MTCAICWVANQVQKSLRQGRRGNQKVESGLKGHLKATLHLLSLSLASSSAAQQPSPPPPASISPASVFPQPAADPYPTSSLPPDEAVPSLL